MNGNEVDISQLTTPELIALQCSEEPAFAKAILEAPKGSEARTHITRVAYSSVCAILEQIAKQECNDHPFAMGMDDRYVSLIDKLLISHTTQGRNGGLFEIGFSSGVLLERIARLGYDVGGVEVVEELWLQARRRLDVEQHARLLLGDFRSLDLSDHRGRYSIVYWNDVFEHIAPDEIAEYLELAYGLLSHGGQLVTITPNWHMRPSDVTDLLAPPRTEAMGFHLKEYTAREVDQLVKAAGFRKVEIPAFVSLNKIYLNKAFSFTRTKLLLEPLLEWLPYRAAVQACRRFGLNCTIATK